MKFDGQQRYVTKLPFIENSENLPDNYILEKKRTENLVSKLRKNPAHLREYDNIINDYLKDGILEEVSPTLRSRIAVGVQISEGGPKFL